MIKQAFLLSEVKKPLIAAALIRYKQAQDAGAAGPAGGTADQGWLDKAVDSVKGVGADALALGKSYGPGIGVGAGAGVLAGLPISVLANAIFGKDKSLRGYLRSALLGSLIGGGVGALGGGGLRYYSESSPERGKAVDETIQSIADAVSGGAKAVLPERFGEQAVVDAIQSAASRAKGIY